MRLRRIVIAVLFAAAIFLLQGATGGQGKGKEKSADKMYEWCAKACLDCAKECVTCHDHCKRLSDAGQKEHDPAAKMLADCAEVCTTAAKIVGRKGPLTAQVCELCAKACEACAAECEKFPKDSQMSKCAKVCREMLTHLSHPHGK